MREAGIGSACVGKCWAQICFFPTDKNQHTVDGRNPAPVGMVNIPISIGFYTSQVVQDFFHQQYHLKNGWLMMVDILVSFFGWPLFRGELLVFGEGNESFILDCTAWHI